jgi:predicted RNA-binding Zn-ribbon protein involved in translation (DUF1610 family)
MEFDPASKALKCPYCGTALAVRRDASSESVPEMPYDRYVHAAESDLARIAGDALQFSCASCGATVQFQPPQIAGTCPFCAAQVVAQAKSADPLIAPQGVLPFHLAKPQASAAVGAWLRSRWFAPNALKQVAKPEGLTGMYLPFWSFDARTESDYRGQRGEYYFVNEEVWVDVNGRRERRLQQVRKVRWYPASGSVEVFFDDLLEPATRAVDARRLSQLEPWDLAKLEPYEPGYLAGFQAQRYQLELEPAFEQAKQMMQPEILIAIRRDIGGDEQQVHRVDTRYFDVTFRHLLLPVWIGAYRFQGKVYQIMVNARTGEVQGERPYSIWKILLLVAVILVVLVVLSQFSGGR